MNPFVSRISTSAWLVPVSVMMLFTGLMLRLAWITNDTRSNRLQSLPADQVRRLSTGDLELAEEYKKLTSEVAKLRDENTRFQNAMAKESGESKLLNESLQQAKAFAGLTEVEGPGVTVTLRDAQEQIDGPPVEAMIIHDFDVLRMVNELWNAGAEAIAINGIRVVAGTNVRCVGSIIMVSGVRIASPVRIQAIGDSATIIGALNTPGGLVEEYRSTDPSMVKIDSTKKMRLPAYTGPTTTRYTKVPKATR